MKLLSKLLLVLALLANTNISKAQKAIDNATIIYNISIETTKGEKQLSNGLNGAVLSIYLNKDKSKTEMVSTIGSETTVYDTKNNKGFILKEFSGQKLMITTTNDNWLQKNQAIKKLTFTTENGDTKIAGYTCKKAVAVNADGKNYTVYYEPNIILANSTYNNAFPQIPGLPVQYELKSGNLIFKYTLSKFTMDYNLPAIFDAPKSGFRVMTYEENQQLKKVE